MRNLAILKIQHYKATSLEKGIHNYPATADFYDAKVLGGRCALLHDMVENVAWFFQ